MCFCLWVVFFFFFDIYIKLALFCGSFELVQRCSEQLLHSWSVVTTFKPLVHSTGLVTVKDLIIHALQKDLIRRSILSRNGEVKEANRKSPREELMRS